MIRLILTFLFTLIPFIQPKAQMPMTKDTAQYETAILAGGCFWCLESDFDHIDGVVETISGYTGGDTENPTYIEVSHQPTGHYEALKVVYDPEKLSYNDILTHFWRFIDPFDDQGQFCDKGSQYRAAIFFLDDVQKQTALQSRADTQEFFKDKIVTKIVKADTFYPAEDYHQDYHNKNPIRYKYYRNGCGRDKRVKAIWNGVKK